MNKEAQNYKIRPQIHKTHSGERLITHAIYCGEVFCAYSRCYCRAKKAAEYLTIQRRDTIQ